MALPIESRIKSSDNIRVHETYGRLTPSEHKELRQRAAHFAYGRELTPEELESMEKTPKPGFNRHEFLPHSVFIVDKSRYESFGSTTEPLKRAAVIASFADSSRVTLILSSRDKAITEEDLPPLS